MPTALAAGADDVVRKADPITELLPAIRRVTQAIEQRDRQCAGQRLGQRQGKAIHTEKVGRRRLEPKAQRRLVDRRLAARLVGGKKEVVSRGQHTLDRGGVVSVADAVSAQLVETQKRARQDDQAQPDDGHLGLAQPEQRSLLGRAPAPTVVNRCGR